jgi:hypothetical protein
MRAGGDYGGWMGLMEGAVVYPSQLPTTTGTAAIPARAPLPDTAHRTPPRIYSDAEWASPQSPRRTTPRSSTVDSHTGLSPAETTTVTGTRTSFTGPPESASHFQAATPGAKGRCA